MTVWWTRLLNPKSIINRFRRNKDVAVSVAWEKIRNSLLIFSSFPRRRIKLFHGTQWRLLLLIRSIPGERFRPTTRLIERGVLRKTTPFPWWMSLKEPIFLPWSTGSLRQVMAFLFQRKFQATALFGMRGTMSFPRTTNQANVHCCEQRFVLHWKFWTTTLTFPTKHKIRCASLLALQARQKRFSRRSPWCCIFLFSVFNVDMILKFWREKIRDYF